MLKKLIIALIAISSFILLDRMCHQKPKEFPMAVYAIGPYLFEGDVSAPSLKEFEKINQILSQPFTYLDKGSQAYVFVSEDQKYVLKFLKQHLFLSNSWLCYIPFEFNSYYKKYRARKQKRIAAYDACRIAYTELKEDTALVYLHLNPTTELKRKVTLINRRGKEKLVEIDKACFMIQKRADLIYPRIAQVMEDGNLAGAEAIVTSVFDLCERMGKRGVFDHDAKVLNNFGLIDDRAVQIDVGNMKLDRNRPSTRVYKQEIREIVGPFGAWIESAYPQLAPHFYNQLALNVD